MGQEVQTGNLTRTVERPDHVVERARTLRGPGPDCVLAPFQASRTFLATATPTAMRIKRMMIFFIGSPALDEPEAARRAS
jgi:hypothetical protein